MPCNYEAIWLKFSIYISCSAIRNTWYELQVKDMIWMMFYLKSHLHRMNVKCKLFFISSCRWTWIKRQLRCSYVWPHSDNRVRKCTTTASTNNCTKTEKQSKWLSDIPAKLHTITINRALGNINCEVFCICTYKWHRDT